MAYNAIIVDSLNLAYRILEKKHTYKTNLVNKKKVYTLLFNEFVETLRQIESKYLDPAGNVIILFDNSDSRQDLKDSFYNVKRKNLYPEYKVHRKKDNVEFYQTVDLIKYYYMVNSERYICIQIPNLEADDLVKPVLEHYVKPHESALFITNDSDWSRYISMKNHMLDHLDKEPSTSEDYALHLGFFISEMNVILYKSLFGDAADNIPQVIRKTSENFAHFLDFVNKNKLQDLNEIAIATRRADHPLFKIADFKLPMSSKKEALYKIDQLLINLRLTSSFPVDIKHILAATVMGRNSTKLKEAVEKATGLLIAKKPFTFGLKKPRV